MKKYIDNIQRVDEELAKCRKKCRCGHTVEVPNSHKGDYKLCNWCGHRVYKNDRTQKEYERKVDSEEFRFRFTQYVKKLELM